ncbi:MULTISPECIES: DUF4352 domain-containing protein [unclassified Methanoregula]|uniref:DUF4352 domain-containing protein n=1 Tax=unclassified Methanoregula TaxID=2649730 RepID=UPI0009CB6720|nr:MULTISPECIES: DUF4352 domain-containing protein [unclassified Methanoregula]OPX62731.1 MAG: hypothetical protein A4E33_02118 [Methanoregula sp. PtaB.Bin085]OPY36969.1 MAG: hypothetical protein A4E34_00149 [Methanoregula sp. PtaU1.Bin006]
MKPVFAVSLFCIAAFLVIVSGCTTPEPRPTTPAPLIITTTTTPVPEPTLYPGALSLNEQVPFGIAGRNGTATVYKAELRSSYQWSSPTYNSPRAQQEAGESLFATQHGYNTRKASEGNTFVFVYVRLENTGKENIVVPSPGQFILHYDGKTYPYGSVGGSDVTVSSVRVGQYDYQIGRGGVAGSLQPGQSNAADGFLIYEVPATIDLSKAAMVVVLDPEHTSAWKLA